MKKRLIAAVLILVFVIFAAGCAGTNSPGADTSAAQETVRTEPESKMPVFDKDGNRLGEIDGRANGTAVDGGIFYSVPNFREYSLTADTEYRFFDAESKKDISFGTVKDQGYEAAFTRTEYNGKIYTLAVEGDPTSDKPVPLVLLSFDRKAGTMKKHTVSDNGFPYASMAESNGKLIIMSHEMSDPKSDKIYEFDPESETLREIMKFSPDADSLRGVCSADNGFYLLRLKIDGGGENELFLDLYNNEHRIVSKTSVSETLIKAIAGIHGMTGRQDALNELGQSVSGFEVEDGRYLIYENFGVTRLIVDLQSGEAVLAEDDLFSVSAGSGKAVVYRMDFDPDVTDGPYIVGITDGRLEKLSFEPSDTHKYIRTVSHSASGTWLVMTSDGFSAQNSTFALRLWSE